MPRSSARYISHISALVEDIFGWGERNKRQSEGKNADKK